jgi:Xeroderma pigmentosum group B helicase damage recognition domain
MRVVAGGGLGGPQNAAADVSAPCAREPRAVARRRRLSPNLPRAKRKSLRTCARSSAGSRSCVSCTRAWTLTQFIAVNEAPSYATRGRHARYDDSMQLQFDRGTLVLAGPAPDQTWRDLPGVKWDRRVQRHRAPAFRYRDIVGTLRARGLVLSRPANEKRPSSRCPSSTWTTLFSMLPGRRRRLLSVQANPETLAGYS